MRAGLLFQWVGWLALALGLATSGCAGDYVARTRAVRRAYESYHPDEAVTQLDALKTPEIDKLVALLDKGMILHAAGLYEASISFLTEADRLSQSLDFTSVGETAKTLLSNEREKTYRGEDFEKLMVSVLQALNYAELGRDEDALVEIRRVNERIRKMVAEEKKPYEQLAIARYLGGGALRERRRAGLRLHRLLGCLQAFAWPDGAQPGRADFAPGKAD